MLGIDLFSWQEYVEPLIYNLQLSVYTTQKSHDTAITSTCIYNSECIDQAIFTPALWLDLPQLRL